MQLDARVLTPFYSNTDRRIRGREDVVLDSFACNFDDYPVTRRDESDITAVELAALHHELAVDPLRWFVDFETGKHCGIPASAEADPDLAHHWKVRPIEFERCGRNGGASEADSELR